MAEVILKNIKKIYPHQEPKKKKKGEPEKKTNLQITEEGVLAVDHFNRHIIIFARAYKDGKKEGAHTKTADGKQGKTEKKQIRRTTGHRKLGQGKEWTGKQLRKTQYDIHNTHK